MATQTANLPTEQEVLGYFDSCSNWGKWGPDDQLGAINHITPEKRKQAAGLVREGVTVGCARPLKKEMAPDVANPLLHYMAGSGECFAGQPNEPGKLQSSSDFFGIAFHGLTVTHVDSLAHVFWNGKMYNGIPAERITTREGAQDGSIDLLREGIVTKGVLLDIPKVRGVKWMDWSESLTPDDLEAAERELGVTVEPGDVLFTRFGVLRRRDEEGPTQRIIRERPGYHAACLPWFHRRQISMLGSDGAQDAVPSGYEQVAMPIHQVGIVAMGLWLIDNANLEDLAAACERYGRWEFMLAIAPLRLHNGTGSPINPVAAF